MYRCGPWFGSKHINYNRPYQWKKEIFRGLLNIVREREALTENQKNFNWCLDSPHYGKSWNMFVKSYRMCGRNFIQIRSTLSATISKREEKNNESQNKGNNVSHSNTKGLSKSGNQLPGRRKIQKLSICPDEPSFNTLLQRVLYKLDQSKPKYVLNEYEYFPVINENSSFEESIDSQGSLLFQDHELDNRLYEKLLKTQHLVKYEEMKGFREKLPCYKIRNDFLNLLADNQVVLVSGSTGCGKSTQLVQYVLDDFIMSKKGSLCNILCIVPRRICAVMLAKRISNERCEKVGVSVGYQIRLQKFLSMQKCGCINFMTSGVFLELAHELNFLHQFSHIFIDEVHERSADSDFALALIKSVLPKKPELKVVLMSATMNGNLFSSYMNGAPQLQVDGLLYPVKDYYLEDILKATKFKFRNTQCKIQDSAFVNKVLPYVKKIETDCSYPNYVTNELKKPISEKINHELIANVIHYIVQNEDNGCILIFLPGMRDILNLKQVICDSPWYSPDKFVIFKMHSLLSSEEQQKAFFPTPDDVWKIIISTSILEISVTVSEIKYIIDTGKINGSIFNEKENVSSLEPIWISKSNALQRKGRAGRVQEGKCFKLYTRARENSFLDFPLPQLLCTNLEELYIKAKSLNIACTETFFKHFIDSPKQSTIDANVKFLSTAGILDSEEKLTPLGKHVSKLPVSCRLGKILIMGAIFSCFDPICSIVACLDERDIFSYSPGNGNELLQKKKRLAGDDMSDHLICSRIVSLWDNSFDESSVCYDNMLSIQAMKQISLLKESYVKSLHSMNFLREITPQHPINNINSENTDLIKAVLCAGLYPNVAFVFGAGKRKSFLCSRSSKFILFHPRSICNSANIFQSPFFVYFDKTKTDTVFIHDATMINILPLILFCKNITILKTNYKRGNCVVNIDDIIELEMPHEIILQLKDVRNHLEWILDRSCQNPEILESLHADILPEIVQLLSSQALQVSK